MNDQLTHDERIPRYIAAAEQLQRGRYDLDVPTTPLDDVGRLHLQRRPIDLSSFFAEAITWHTTMAAPKGTRIVRPADP